MESLSKLGLDLGGMVIYFVNYGVILGILSYFVYPKIIKAIDERRAKINDSLDEAIKLREDMTSQISKHTKEKEDLQQKLLNELEQDREKFKKEYQDKRAELIKKMDEERNKMLDEAKEQITKDKEIMLKDAEKEIVSMIERVILKILSHQIPEDVVKKSVQEAWSSQK